jgi:hypothetical protein
LPAAHDRHLRFTLPDPVAVTEEREHAPGAWMSHRDAKTSVLMQINGLGAFVRALLPIQLTGGYTVTYGVWISVHPDDLQKAADVWDTPAYANLGVLGVLANSIPPWGLLAAPIHASVRSRQHTPYCDVSPNERVAKLLGEQWPHDVVLNGIEGLVE